MQRLALAGDGAKGAASALIYCLLAEFSVSFAL